MKKGFFLTIAVCFGFTFCTGCFSSNAPSQSSKHSEVVNSQSQSQTNKSDTTDQKLKNGSEPTGKVNGSLASPTTASVKQMDVEQPAITNQVSSPSSTNEEKSSQTNVSVDQVKEKYVTQLQQLEGYYKSQLQGLYGQAMAAKQHGESNANIYNNYSQKAMALQDDSQDQVNQILFQLKNELKSDNLPMDCVNQLRSAYYQAISQEKTDMSEKIKSGTSS